MPLSPAYRHHVDELAPERSSDLTQSRCRPGIQHPTRISVTLLTQRRRDPRARSRVFVTWPNAVASGKRRRAPDNRDRPITRVPGADDRRLERPVPCVRCRVAYYSLDTMGLGHMRRNLLLAQALRRSRLHAMVRMIAGAREACLLTRAGGIDCVALPSLLKDADGRYHPRHLEVSLREVLALRTATARAALDAFDPDVLIVDNVPRGALRELDPVLESLHARRRALLVLGLRRS